jgi:DNA-binding XRE family transcriptional regulator
MTTQTASSKSEFAPRSTAFRQPPETTTGKVVAKVYELHVPESTVELPVGFTRIGDYVSQIESSAQGAANVRDARARLATALEGHGAPTLRSMRLALGLSQSELAAKIVTSQAQIARIETGAQDPTYNTFDRFARALGVDVTDVVAAFREARKAS